MSEGRRNPSSRRSACCLPGRAAGRRARQPLTPRGTARETTRKFLAEPDRSRWAGVCGGQGGSRVCQFELHHGKVCLEALETAVRRRPWHRPTGGQDCRRCRGRRSDPDARLDKGPRYGNLAAPLEQGRQVHARSGERASRSRRRPAGAPRPRWSVGRGWRSGSPRPGAGCPRRRSCGRPTRSGR